MGTASLVLGIVSVVIGLVPFCGMICFAPAIIGLVLGIIETVRRSKTQETKSSSVAGIVLSAVAIVEIMIWFIIVISSDI